VKRKKLIQKKKQKLKKIADEKAADEEYDILADVNQQIEDKKAEIDATDDPKEKAKLKAELDKLIFKKKGSQKKIADLTGRDVGKEEAEEKSKKEAAEKEDKEKSKADEEEKKTEEINKLKAEISDTESNLKASLNAKNEEINALMAETDEIVGGNGMLKSFVAGLRLQNRISYNKMLAQLTIDNEQKKEIEDKIKEGEGELQDNTKKLQADEAASDEDAQKMVQTKINKK